MTPLATLAPSPAAGADEQALRHLAMQMVMAAERDSAPWQGYRASPPSARLAVLRYLGQMPRSPQILRVAEAASWLHDWLQRGGR